MKIVKTRAGTMEFEPFEDVTIKPTENGVRRLVVRDGAGRAYVERTVRPGQAVRFKIRGQTGRHLVSLQDTAGQIIAEQSLRVVAQTQIWCNAGPYAKLMTAVQKMIVASADSRPLVVNDRSYRILVGWSRDHVYTLKAARYFLDDVKSGLEYFLESQLPSGMFWDCIYVNQDRPAPTWFAEALGEGWFRYDEGMKYNVRRVPVLADTEYVFAEGVWLAWKASGDDAWMATQLPRLEKALVYLTSDPLRWSEKFQMIRRSFTADEWDFANGKFCAGDHRCIYPQDPRFLFHGNQSGLYAMYWRMAEMYEQLGDTARAADLRREGAGLRERANAKLFFETHYGHMIPETMDEKKAYEIVGDERQRMSLSTGYTINRKMPTHDMAVKILKEYQRRRKAEKSKSFAEWWSMDPMYAPEQWPGQSSNTAGCPQGEYMNGGISPLVAGELAKAAFDHGMEAYGTDILERLWDLAQRDGGYLYQVYKRLPEKVELPAAKFQHVDLRAIVNRGLKQGAHSTVEAWLGEGANDMRNLPTGRKSFGPIVFDVIAPARNGGRAVLRLDADGVKAPARVTVPVANLKGKSVYFLHCTGRTTRKPLIASYEFLYEDGSVERLLVRPGREIAHWWGTGEETVDRTIARRAWWGANATWKNVGLYMLGWNNPHPDKAITAIRIEMAAESNAIVMLGGISVSDQPVAFEMNIRSYGLPDCWAQAAVYYAVAEGLSGIEDAGAAFSAVDVAPRWAATQADQAKVTLHYPASGAYCAYEYRLDHKRRRITLDLTGSFGRANVHCLLPAGKAREVLADGAAIKFTNSRIEKSSYVDFTLEQLPQGPVVIDY